ncbi:MAG: TolC family protein [Alphaproteobacteria bacterium]|nr:TolC family protein [Alphaproteobacteria bacterium]
MKKLIIALLFMPFAANAADDCNTRKTVPSDPQTLQEIVEMGLCRNPNTAASYLAAKQSRMNRNAGFAPYLPDVSASASVSRRYATETWSDNMTSTGLSASWLIFDFGKRESDFGNLNASFRAANLDYNNTVQNYIYELVAAYYGMLSSDAEITAAKELVTVARGAKQTADTKFKAGTVARADVLRADTNMAARELELQRATGNGQIARGRILFLLSFPQDQELQITDMPIEFGSAAEMKNVEELIERAKRQRPDLLSAEASASAAWHRRNAAFLRNLPSISANGNLSYDPTKNYDQYGAGPDYKFDGSTIGIRASMPIFAGFANMNNIRATQAAYERANELARAREDTVAMDIWTAYQNYQTAQKVLVQTGALLKSATESERVVAGMYKVGRATMLDWQTAQADLASARRQDITARYDLYVKRASMALALGELRENLKN